MIVIHVSLLYDIPSTRIKTFYALPYHHMLVIDGYFCFSADILRDGHSMTSGSSCSSSLKFIYVAFSVLKSQDRRLQFELAAEARLQPEGDCAGLGNSSFYLSTCG
jgi:hypothetical protein